MLSCADVYVYIIYVCAAGFTLPFAMKYIIETYNPPDIKHPPTVKEVRHKGQWRPLRALPP